MSVIHIPAEEASKDLDDLMSKALRGDEVLIEGSTAYFKLVPHGPIPRTGAEILARIAARPGPRGIMDPDFARDIRSFRERHPESLDGSKWD